jgi:hypothetical protein
MNAPGERALMCSCKANFTFAEGGYTSDMDISTIGAIIKKERVSCGLTQETLAKVSRVSRVTLVNLEHGKVGDIGAVKLWGHWVRTQYRPIDERLSVIPHHPKSGGFAQAQFARHHADDAQSESGG